MTARPAVDPLAVINRKRAGGRLTDADITGMVTGYMTGQIPTTRPPPGSWPSPAKAWTLKKRSRSPRP
ncbi:hypothetical protein Jiend_50060 [Micromonospora endophytica]|nr:hypothetical protein Jiend_50060 [Micromonospora endophytica]